MELKDGHTTVKELVAQVAEEEGMTITEAWDVWRHQKHYIEKLQKEEGVYAIFLPYIGTLCLNVKQTYKEKIGRRLSKHQEFIEKVKDLEKHENYTYYANAHKRVSGPNRLARTIIRNYHTGIEKVRRIIPIARCFEIIEKYSNGVYEKRDEPITKKSQAEIEEEYATRYRE